MNDFCMWLTVSIYYPRFSTDFLEDLRFLLCSLTINLSFEYLKEDIHTSLDSAFDKLNIAIFQFIYLSEMDVCKYDPSKSKAWLLVGSGPGDAGTELESTTHWRLTVEPWSGVVSLINDHWSLIVDCEMWELTLSGEVSPVHCSPGWWAW